MADTRAHGALTAAVAEDAKSESFTLYYQITDGEYRSPVGSVVVDRDHPFRAHGDDSDINGKDYHNRRQEDFGQCIACAGTDCDWRCGSKYSVWTDVSTYGRLEAYASTINVTLRRKADGIGYYFDVQSSTQTQCKSCGKGLGSAEPRPIPGPQPERKTGSIVALILLGVGLLVGLLLLLWGLWQRGRRM